MKKFTDTQKKWALTATMIAALGCSVSFQSPQHSVTSMEFASNGSEAAVDRTTTKTVEKEKKLNFAKTDLTNDGEILDVKLVRNGDNDTTVVISPRKNTEGKSVAECVVCETKSLNVNMELLTGNIDAIRSQASKQYAELKTSTVVKTASNKKEDDRELSDREKEREDKKEEARSKRESIAEDKQRIKDFVDDADCRSESSKSDRSACVARAYLDALNEEIEVKYTDRKGRTRYEYRPLDSKVALDYYVKNVEPSLKSDLKQSGSNSAIFDVLAEVPSDFNNVRERALSQTTSTMMDAVVDFRDSIYRATQTRSSSDRLRAQQNQLEVHNLYSGLTQSNTSALMEAYQRGNIGYQEARDLFENDFNRTASDLYTGSSKWLAMNSQGRITPNLNAYIVPTDISGSFNGSIRSSDLDSRFSSIRADGVLLAPGYGPNGQLLNQQGQQSSTVTLPPQMLQNGNSNGLQFGQPRAVQGQRY